MTDIVSHNEGYYRGIASAHVDPEHLWKGLGMGYTMDGFRNDVKNAMSGTTTATVSTPEKVVANNTTTTYTLKQFIKDVQKATGAAVDGIAGKETLSKTVTVSAKVNNNHAVVKPIQKRLNALGFNCGVADGIIGKNTTAGIIAYQKSKGCVQDGELTAHHRTWQHILEII